jgi:hypothetical protein
MLSASSRKRKRRPDAEFRQENQTVARVMSLLWNLQALAETPTLVRPDSANESYDLYERELGSISTDLWHPDTHAAMALAGPEDSSETDSARHIAVHGTQVSRICRLSWAPSRGVDCLLVTAAIG